KSGAGRRDGRVRLGRDSRVVGNGTAGNQQQPALREGRRPPLGPACSHSRKSERATEVANAPARSTFAQSDKPAVSLREIDVDGANIDPVFRRAFIYSEVSG